MIILLYIFFVFTSRGNCNPMMGETVNPVWTIKDLKSNELQKGYSYLKTET